MSFRHYEAPYTHAHRHVNSNSHEARSKEPEKFIHERRAHVNQLDQSRLLSAP